MSLIPLQERVRHTDCGVFFIRSGYPRLSAAVRDVKIVFVYFEAEIFFSYKKYKKSYIK